MVSDAQSEIQKLDYYASPNIIPFHQLRTVINNSKVDFTYVRLWLRLDLDALRLMKGSMAGDLLSVAVVMRIHRFFLNVIFPSNNVNFNTIRDNR